MLSAPFAGNWSFSKLQNWETCAFRFKLEYIDKLPKPVQPPENPMVRGNRVHSRLENYIKGKGGIDTEAKAIEPFVPALDVLQELYAGGIATAEDNWFYNYDWEPCDKDNVWLWAKLDFSVQDQDEAHVIVGDFKTGKSNYKVVEHVQQIQLYAGIAAIRYEWAERITPELWYLDEGWVRGTEYTREEALKFIGRFDDRVMRMYDDKVFKPNPSKPICKYCPFGRANGTGACPVGVV